MMKSVSNLLLLLLDATGIIHIQQFIQKKGKICAFELSFCGYVRVRTYCLQ